MSGVPNHVASRIRELYEEHGGERLAQHVLDAAKAGDEHLAGYFEWDDSKAADAHRLQQARALIARVKVTLAQPDPEAEPIRVRAYISQKTLPAGDEEPPVGSYVSFDDLAANPAAQKAVMEALSRDVARLRRKWRHLGEAFEMALRDAIGEQQAS